MKFLYPIIPSGINPSIGIGPTQGQRKTLTRVGFEPTTFGLDHRYKARTGAGRGYVRCSTKGQIRLGPSLILFRYAPHYGIIMHTSYLPTGQRSRLKEVIQMQISSHINPRKRRNNQFFLSCFTRSASSFCLSVLRFLFWFRLSGDVPCSFTHVCCFRLINSFS